MKRLILHLIRELGYELLKIERTDSSRSNDKVLQRVVADPIDYWSYQKYLEKQEFKYILWLDRVFEKIQNVPGHIVELGVAYGRNTIIFSHLIDMHNETDIRRYYGFDTFDGYNQESLDNNKTLSANSWKSISVSKIQERVRKAAVRTKVDFIKGDIMETIPFFTDANPNLRIALLYVDCNAYEPSLFGIRSLKNYMSPGGVICIDEKMQGGETKALIEFCQENNLKFIKDKSPFSIPAYTVI